MTAFIFLNAYILIGAFEIFFSETSMISMKNRISYIADCASSDAVRYRVPEYPLLGYHYTCQQPRKS